MREGPRNSLARYATRRFSLAGSRLLTGPNPFFRVMDETVRDDNEQISFAHYDYLGLNHEPTVRQAAAEAALMHGTGVGASRLVGGERSFQRKLERELADFVGTEGALAMVSGYGTNASLISHLLTADDAIFYDELAHNSIVAGVRGSRAEDIVFSHNSCDSLEAALRERRKNYSRALVVTEGLFSMDGDIPDLPRILELCKRYDAWLMLDEAHSIGVLGKTGRGLTEHFGIPPSEIDLIVGTLSKSFASCGGFILGGTEVIEWLRYTLPGFVFSVGVAPGIAAGASAALAKLRQEPARVDQANLMARIFVKEAKARGFDVGVAIGAGVVPVMFADAMQTLSASQWLMNHGIYVPPIIQIGVPKELPRLRFFITCRHSTADIVRVFDALEEWRRVGDFQSAAE